LASLVLSGRLLKDPVDLLDAGGELLHPEEEVYEVIEGELEVTIDGVAQTVRAGLVAIVPGNVRHSVKALTDGRAIIVDYPARRDFA
jgi:quercetin dioxygenase-like cupin family protein